MSNYALFIACPTIMQYAIASTSQEAHGAKAVINVWDPSVLEGNEFSLAQMWVFGGAYDVSDLNSVEAGWQVPLQISI